MATTVSQKEWIALNQEYGEQEVALGEVPSVGMWHSIQRALVPGKLDETQLMLLWGEGVPNAEVIDDDQARALLHLLQAYFNEENK